MNVVTQFRRRTLNRITFDKDDGITAKLHCNKDGQCRELTIQQVVDLNGEGMSLLVDEHEELLKRTEIQKITILLKDKQISTKTIDKRIDHRIYAGQKEFLRASFVFDQKGSNRSYYLPRDMLKRVKMGLYKIADGVEPKLILRSILGNGTKYRNLRKSLRLRLSFSDGMVAFLFFQRRSEPIRVDRVADISSNGIGCYMPTIDMFAVSNGKLEKVILSYKNHILTEKRVRKFSITQIEIEDQLLYKISIGFDQEVRISMGNNSYLCHEDGTARLIDKSVLPRVVQAMVSNASDVQVGVAVDEETKNIIYRLRYEAYLAEGKINTRDYPEGAIKDAYDEKSLQIYLHIHGHIVAAARITFDTMYPQLDVENLYTKESLRRPGLKYAEVSRFCIDELFRNNINKTVNIILKLFLEIYRISLLQKVDAYLITAYKPHINLYRTIGFEPVSEPITIPNFNFVYVVMSWDLNYHKVGKLLRPFFKRVWHDTQSPAAVQSYQPFADEHLQEN